MIRFADKDVRSDSEYDENMILIVWDNYINQKLSGIRYFITETETLSRLSREDQMAPKKDAGLLIKDDYTLYANHFGCSVSICGPVDQQGNVSGTAVVTTNMQVAIEQITTWNNSHSTNQIDNHQIIFPYHITNDHWALGVLHLNFTQRTAEIKVYNPLPGHGGQQISDEAYGLLRVLVQSQLNLHLLDNQPSTHIKQQNDGRSCGAISAENGKDFLDSETPSQSRLEVVYNAGATDLRLQHLNEIGRQDFCDAQLVYYSDPQYSNPINYNELKQSFKDGLSKLSAKTKKEFLWIIPRISQSASQEEVAVRVKDFMKAHHECFDARSLACLFEDDAGGYKFRGDSINALIKITKWYRDTTKKTQYGDSAKKSTQIKSKLYPGDSSDEEDISHSWDNLKTKAKVLGESKDSLFLSSFILCEASQSLLHSEAVKQKYYKEKAYIVNEMKAMMPGAQSRTSKTEKDTADQSELIDNKLRQFMSVKFLKDLAIAPQDQDVGHKHKKVKKEYDPVAEKIQKFIDKVEKTGWHVFVDAVGDSTLSAIMCQQKYKSIVMDIVKRLLLPKDVAGDVIASLADLIVQISQEYLQAPVYDHSVLLQYRPEEYFKEDFAQTLSNLKLDHRILRGKIKENAIKDCNETLTKTFKVGKILEERKGIYEHEVSETTRIYTTGSRVDIIHIKGNQPAYMDISTVLGKCKDSKMLTQGIKDIIRGRELPQIDGIDKYFLASVVHLLFKCEPERDISSLLTNAMFFELVAVGKISDIGNALPRILPMSMVGAVDASRYTLDFLSGAYQEEDDDGEWVSGTKYLTNRQFYDLKDGDKADAEYLAIRNALLLIKWIEFKFQILLDRNIEDLERVSKSIDYYHRELKDTDQKTGVNVPQYLKGKADLLRTATTLLNPLLESYILSNIDKLHSMLAGLVKEWYGLELLEECHGVDQELEGSSVCLYNDTDIGDINKYWGKYTLDGIAKILKLRINDLNLLKDILVLDAIFLDEENSNIHELIKKIVAVDEDKTILVPLNIFNKHAVGLVLEKSAGNVIKITYMDPSNEEMPKPLKGLIYSELRQIDYEIEVVIQELSVEHQRYANCGPEVIENFIYYLTGSRVSQEEAIELHSELMEQKLKYSQGDVVSILFDHAFDNEDSVVDFAGLVLQNHIESDSV